MKFGAEVVAVYEVLGTQTWSGHRKYIVSSSLSTHRLFFLHMSYLQKENNIGHFLSCCALWLGSHRLPTCIYIYIYIYIYTHIRARAHREQAVGVQFYLFLV
jgi:hypothetical protein